jgi:4-hydroxybenzoate polyprenyltransferase
MLKKAMKFVKIEHALFSLPLFFAGALLSRPWIGWENVDWPRLGLIVLAGMGARTAALALNRLLDARIDAKNPRTADRELPQGALNRKQGWSIVLVGLIVYFLAAAALGPLCLQLAPLPLLVFVIYPLMKRFTWACHFGVGLGLALAPVGGAIGYEPVWPPNEAVWWLGAFAFFWVSGFDVLYALLDEAFDRKEGLYSIPSRFGRPTALDLGLMLHGAALLCLGALVHHYFEPRLGLVAWLAMAPAGILLLLEQHFGYSLEPGSPFFTINAWIGVAVGLGVGIGIIAG